MFVRRLLVITLAALMLVAPSAAAQSDVVSVPVKFKVRNVNGTAIPCQADGAEYELHAELVGPRAALQGNRSPAATLYLHEFSFDDFWHFKAVPGYDYATELAKAGHVSVTLDRLGYDDSPHPSGSATCLGAQADMAHQIVQALRAGTYSSSDGPKPAFDRVVLGGHSVGALVAEAEAYSFKDVDGLLLFGHTSRDYTPRAIQEGVEQNAVCTTGGDPSAPQPGYAFYGSEQDTDEISFFDPEPEVFAAAMAARHRDPCGDASSLSSAAAVNYNRSPEITVPVLLLYGRNDGVLTPDAGENQRQRYASEDVSVAYFERMSHAMTLERTAPALRPVAIDWLNAHGFGSAAARRLRPCSFAPTVRSGSQAADELRGNASDETLFGLGGDDRVFGRGGTDCLSGAGGADRLVGGKARDRLLGGRGDDVVRAADGERDGVNCGRGSGDRAVVDALDRVRRCERVRRR